MSQIPIMTPIYFLRSAVSPNASSASNVPEDMDMAIEDEIIILAGFIGTQLNHNNR